MFGCFLFPTIRRWSKQMNVTKDRNLLDVVRQATRDLRHNQTFCEPPADLKWGTAHGFIAISQVHVIVAQEGGSLAPSFIVNLC
jgi:hypothetical protein